MVKVPGFPRSLDKEKANMTPEVTKIDQVIMSAPEAKIERFYQIARVPGEVANCAVEELTIQGERVLGRKLVSDRDNRPGAEARLMAIMSRGNR